MTGGRSCRKELLPLNMMGPISPLYGRIPFPLLMEGPGVASLHNDLLAVVNINALGIRIPTQFPAIQRVPVFLKW